MCFFQGESYKKGKEQGRKDEREEIVAMLDDSFKKAKLTLRLDSSVSRCTRFGIRVYLDELSRGLKSRIEQKGGSE